MPAGWFGLLGRPMGNGRVGLFEHLHRAGSVRVRKAVGLDKCMDGLRNVGEWCAGLKGWAYAKPSGWVGKLLACAC